MTRTGATVIAVLAAGILAGCDIPAPGTPRVLGNVEYSSAYAAARQVLGQYFTIASDSPDTGVIVSHPIPVEARGERLLGGSPARHLARLQLQRKNGLVVAHLSIALQREGSAIRRTMPAPEENYSSVPNRTPAEESAAVSPEQNEAWQTEQYDRAMERGILDELYKALHPKGD